MKQKFKKKSILTIRPGKCISRRNVPWRWWLRTIRSLSKPGGYEVEPYREKLN
jgi:hypothetical protein